MKRAQKITEADRRALAKIAECGFIGVDANGETWLENSKRVTPGRLRRMIELGLVRSNEDALIDGIHAQTYGPA